MMKVSRNPWWLKVFATCFSLLLWVYVTSNLKTESDVTLRIEYKLPPDISFKSDVIEQATVTIRGPHSLLRKKEDLFYTVDLTKDFNERKKKMTINLKTIDLNLPFGLEVVNVEPSRLDLEFDRKIWKYVPVKYTTMGALPEEFQLERVDQLIKQVRISGARSLLKNIGKLTLDPIDLSKLTQSGTKTQAVELDDARVQFEPSKIPVKIEIKPIKSNLRLNNIRIQFLTSSAISNPSVQTVTVLLLVNDEKQATNITSDAITVIAKLPKDAIGNTVVPLEVQLPPGVALLKTIPEFVSVDVEREL